MKNYVNKMDVFVKNDNGCKRERGAVGWTLRGTTLLCR